MPKTDQDRIAELEAQLAEVQSEEGTGQDPELLAKAKEYARRGWMDVAFCLEHLEIDLNADTVKDVQTALVNRKYESLAGNNKTALSWQN